MARYADVPRDLIDSTMDMLKERCLLADGSLTSPEREDVWTGAHARDLYQRFTATESGSFDDQWREQLSDAPAALRVFAAEVLLVYFLFASSVSGARKRAVIANTFAGTDLALPEDSVPMKALDQHIGHPGIGFNARRDLQVGYLIDFVARWKELSDERQAELLESPWQLRDFADGTERDRREMRHILLHLLRPDEFERIASGSQKRQIQAAFEGMLDDSQRADDVDEELFAIRGRLGEHLPPEGNTGTGAIDFYHPPLEEVWDSSRGGEGVADMDALAWKKQLVLYGPPGTSKTFQAERLAKGFVRREAMRRWGPAAYFRNRDTLEEMVQSHLFWLQLHPGYSYDEFVRGLRLEDGRTRYRPGLLFEVIDRYHKQQPPEGLDPLPVVLVLDEINRTDMSRMLGEVFSLLERDQRGKERLLPGIDADEEPMRLALPSDLYLIGTMNEIDQSVESLDFALRRRFLWSECPFERDTLLTIVQATWHKNVAGRRFQFEDAEEQLELFADRAQALNAAISNSPELGSQYEIGHTYFADITFFIGDWVKGRRQKPQKGTYLWTGKGTPQPPLDGLWDRSLKPLLEQYLAGSDQRDKVVADLADVFLTR